MGRGGRASGEKSQAVEKFAYKGTDRRGEIHSGILEAVNEEEARLALASRGLKIIDMKPLDATLTSGRLKLSSLPLTPPPPAEAPEAKSRLFREKSRSPEPLAPPLPPPPPVLQPPPPLPPLLEPPPPLPPLLEPPPPLPPRLDPPPPLPPPPAPPLSRRPSGEGPPPAPLSPPPAPEPGPVMPAFPNPRLTGEEPTVILPPLTPEQRAELFGEEPPTLGPPPAEVGPEPPTVMPPPLPPGPVPGRIDSPPPATAPAAPAKSPPAKPAPAPPPPRPASEPTQAVAAAKPTPPKASAAQAALAEIDFSPPPARKGGPGKIEVHAAPASRSRPGPRKIPRVTAGAFRPRAFQEWLEALMIPRRFLNMVWGTLAVLGMLVMIGQAVSSHSARKDQPPGQVAYHNVTLKIGGSAALSDASSVTGVKVTLHLPEIPLDLQEDLSKIKTTDRGDFVYETSFSSQKVPTYCIITASCKGYDSKDTKELPLTGDPLAVEAPPLLLTPTRATKRY